MASQILTVLFTDLVGSVKMYSKVSDSVAVDLVRKLDAGVQEILPRFRGRFIKSTGDGQLLTFEEAPSAVRSAKEIHSICDRLARELRQDVFVRIAAHTADVVLGENDVLGNGVNLAARILSITGACETCVTQESWSLLSPEDREGYVRHGPEVFKGFTRYAFIYKKPNPNPLTDVTFKPLSAADEETSMMTTETMPKHARYALELNHPQVRKTLLLSEGETHVIGRAPECTTQVPDKMLSGNHLALAVVEGILWCFDLQSSNGVLYRGKKIKRRKPIETNALIQLPNGSIEVKLP
jgi:hypothetical protein